MRLVKFREDPQQIAEDYLKDQDMKLGYRASRTASICDYAAYSQGHKDSKKINLERKRITE